MSEPQKIFQTVAEKLGFNQIAAKSYVTYQAVSRMARNPQLGFKRNIRGRILSATLDMAREEAQKWNQYVAELEKWKTEELQA
ncbi:hypothetical protein GCM10023189_42880 [Nibrella saemangeumensis]|uniref:Uncharacterized protein n=1 Tax=Nibrella saemangeumensis TaxID=1084526 RepID=A0ABP8NAJ0_9BACT